MKILIASDHAGFSFKQELIQHFSEDVAFQKSLGSLEFVDLGPLSEERCDYPDFADKVAKEVLKNNSTSNENKTLGVLICGSGQGMAMRANKYPGVRAALCWSVESAQLSRAHNDANILCLGARLLDKQLAYEIFQTFLHTPFEGDRHAARVKKISNPIS
jgi:ribose 5-phosphate isomerase B